MQLIKLDNLSLNAIDTMPMVEPRVSVVVPAYNAAGTVEAAVRSALGQTMEELEVIVCDDASIDETLCVLQSIHDPRLVIVNHETNQGEGAARDRAIMAARGEWVAVMDADDVWDERRLECMLDATRGEPDVLVFDDLLICHHTADGLVPWRSMRGRKAFRGNGESPVDVPPEAWAASYQFLIKPLIHAESLRRSRVRHTTLKFGADTEFFLKLIAHGFRLRYVPRPYYWYRITPNSASANEKRSDLMNGMLESMLPALSHLPKVQKAILRRIQYRVFLKELKAGRVLGAVRVGLSSPGVFLEFIHRAIRQAVYYGHRRLNSGLSR